MMTHAKMGHQRDGGALNINALQLLVFLYKLLYSFFKVNEHLMNLRSVAL